ncbi:MAG TPA: PAS domain S-box protein [Stellaceae bacterium]|nr:PAS domain S-box protein [Stellaceae bacterium]
MADRVVVAEIGSRDGEAIVVPAQLPGVEEAINRRIFETSVDLILVVDRHGTFIRISPSARTILGYDPDELIGRSAREILYPPDLDNTREEMRRSRRHGETRYFECRYVHRDGRQVPLAWTGVWSDAEQQHFFIGRDITERREAEARLRQVQKMEAIGNLTGGLAHDFNNLLGVIIGNLDMVRAGGALPPEDGELVADALDAALRGAELTRRLLAFARRQPLAPADIAINALVGDIVGLMRRTLGEDISIEVDLAGDLWPVHADPAQLEAAILNLANNARDAMPSGGRLMITTGNRHLDSDYAALHPELAPGDYAMVEVTDSGTGIPLETIDHIFEPFFTTKEQGKGTGLGLSMVFGFIKQSSGHINVYSEAGSGTTFRLYLPRRVEQPAPALAPLAAAQSAGGNEAVLLVEDNDAMRRVARRQLEALGYRVLEAEQASAALDILAAEPVDLLFSDILMPGGISGFELARTAIARWPGLKVLLASGFPEAKMQGNGESISGVRLLSKPYRREELARALRESLEAPPRV